MLGYTVLAYMIILGAWFYFLNQADWHPGLLTAFSVCMMLFIVLFLPPVLVVGVLVNRAMGRQLGLLTSINLENATCQLYLSRRCQEGHANAHGEQSMQDIMGAQEFSRAIALNLELDTNNMFGVLGLQLTLPKLVSLASASSTLMVFIWSKGGNRLVDLASYRLD